MGESHRWWYPPESTHGRFWPSSLASSSSHWPAGIFAAPLIGLFQKAFETKNYSQCTGPAREQGIEKIAIYGYETGEARHAARQLANGSWTSKMGHSVDIEHETLEALEGAFYGKVRVYMARSETGDCPETPSFPSIVVP
jgi:sulfite reductase alpha subunit-like flavoprotein